VKLTPTGVPNAGYADGGVYRRAVGANAIAMDLAVEPDGAVDILYSPGTYTGRRLSRLAPNGTPIANLELDFAGPDYNHGQLAVNANGALSLLLGRRGGVFEGVPGCSLQALRYQPHASAQTFTVDTQWSGGAPRPLSDQDCPLVFVRDARVDGAGRLVGFASTPDITAIFRYLPGGAPDASFGGGGRRDIDPANLLYKLVPQPADRRVVLAGQVEVSGVSRFVFCRLRENGSDDTGFANGSPCTTQAFTGSGGVPMDAFAVDVTIGARGRILAAGTRLWTSTDSDFAIAALRGTARVFFSGLE